MTQPQTTQQRATRPQVTTFGDLLRDVASQLDSVTEARWVLESAAGSSDSQPPLDLHRQAPGHVALAAQRMVERRKAGEPLQYVLGTWAFRELEVRVDPRVLIPRPETEQVVGYALEELRRVPAEEAEQQLVLADEAPPVDGAAEPLADGAAEPLADGSVDTLADGSAEPFVTVDLGTGSGVVALSLAAEAAVGGRRALEVWATDDCDDALEVARTNLDLLRMVDPDAAGRVHLSKGSWFDALEPTLAGKVGLLVSNPPYVSAAEWRSLDPVVRDHEPRHALVAGETGREVLERLVSGSAAWLAPGGVLVLELAPHQAGQVASSAKSAGFAQVEVRADLGGLPRVLVARWPGV
jgi:release factor glutamine methyltransferase